MANVNTRVVKRAAKLLRENPSLKHYEAMDRARRELDEMDKGTISGVSSEEERNTTR